MKVEKISLEKVKSRLKKHKRKHEIQPETFEDVD